MTKFIAPAILCLAAVFLSCNTSKKTILLNQNDPGAWIKTGDVTMKGGTLSLSGKKASARLKTGNYKDFVLSLDVQTQPGADGYIGIHTDESGKGYKIAVNNTPTRSNWWKLTGSLLSVRNITKSPAKNNEWFNMNIEVRGHLVAVKINGQPVVEYTEPRLPYRNKENAKALLSSGTFSIVSLSDAMIQTKNLTVEAIDPRTIDADLQLVSAVDEQQDEIIRIHQEDFPVLDYHVHLKGGLTREGAAVQSRHVGINYALAPNCGIGFPINDDAGIYRFLDTMRSQPFILAMQAEGREWLTTFSKSARDEFDYVFTDAMTFTDNKGKRTRLWISDEVAIDNEQEYMDMIVDRICMVLQEPVDVYVNPFFLPEQMRDRYDQFWTESRMNKAIAALAKSGKALEINARYQIPNKALILKAKQAGVKFTFGTNNVESDVSKLEYCIRMKKECGLTSKDMYQPSVKIYDKNKKSLEIR